MTDHEKELLKSAYAVTDCFREIIADSISPETKVLYMTDDWEGLDAACGILGELIGEPGYRKRVITKPETREILIRACQGIHMSCANAKEDSELQTICLSLESCLYSALNMTADDAEMQDAMNRIFTACDWGLEILDSLDAAGEETLAAMQLSRSADMLWDRRDQVREALRMLRPKYDPERDAGGEVKPDEEKEQKPEAEAGAGEAAQN